MEEPARDVRKPVSNRHTQKKRPSDIWLEDVIRRRLCRQGDPGLRSCMIACLRRPAARLLGVRR
jgi:hypothetical protein